MHLRTLLSLLAVLCIAVAQSKPKLPIYVGVGYDLIYGNPKDDRVDPGFRHQILNEYTYEKGQTTSDKEYLLPNPDQVSYRASDSCSLTSTSSVFSGGHSYQQDLNAKVDISAGYDGVINQASFTLSAEYKSMTQSTVNESKRITHASAECHVYQLDIDPSNPSSLSPNFIKGVLESYNSSNWRKFISQFGTHLVQKVTMGGRATEEITYTEKAVSQMKSMEIDISAAAKASFGKYFGDASINGSTNSTDSTYAQSTSESVRQFYVGGAPLRTGNLSQWQKNVVSNPMPVHIKLMDIANLFLLMEDSKSFNASLATKSFYHALDEYCSGISCHAPEADSDLPPPSKVQTAPSKVWHGFKPSAADQKPTNSSQWITNKLPFMDLKKVIVGVGDSIEWLQFMFSDGVKTETSPIFGNQFGGQKKIQWEVPAGQHVTQVQTTIDVNTNQLDSIRLSTANGTQSPLIQAKHDYRESTMEYIPEGHRIVGYQYVNTGKSILLNFVYGNTSYSGPEQPPSIVSTAQYIEL